MWSFFPPNRRWDWCPQRFMDVSYLGLWYKPGTNTFPKQPVANCYSSCISVRFSRGNQHHPSGYYPSNLCIIQQIIWRWHQGSWFAITWWWVSAFTSATWTHFPFAEMVNTFPHSGLQIYHPPIKSKSISFASGKDPEDLLCGFPWWLESISCLIQHG